MDKKNSVLTVISENRFLHILLSIVLGFVVGAFFLLVMGLDAIPERSIALISSAFFTTSNLTSLRKAARRSLLVCTEFSPPISAM